MTILLALIAIVILGVIVSYLRNGTGAAPRSGVPVDNDTPSGNAPR
jgi:hypothetical protein